MIKGTGIIPFMYFNKEKAFLLPIPKGSIRKLYKIPSKVVKVNSSSMINYGGNQYSVPPKYLGESLTIQIYDGYLHAYYNTEFVTAHKLSDKKLNYHKKDYIAIAKISRCFKEEDINIRAKENLKLLGGGNVNEHNTSTINKQP